MVPPEPAQEPTHSAWDELIELAERTERLAQEGADALLDWMPPLPSTERIESDVQAVVDEALERVGLPSTERVGDVVEDIARSVGVPEPFRPRLPRAQDAWRGLVDGAQWVEVQLAPLAEELGRVEPERSRLDGRPPRGEPQPPATEPADDDWSVVEWFLFVLALDWLSRQELVIELDVDAALWTFEVGDDETLQQWDKLVFKPEAGFAARLGDVMLHGGRIAPGLGSTNVLIGGRPALRSCDTHVCGAATPLPHAGAGFFATYDRVEINGFAGLRVGDYVDEGPHGLNPIVTGCPAVTIGPKPPSVECWAPGKNAPMPSRGPFGFRWRKAELGRFKGKVVLGVDIGGPLVRVEGTITAAKLFAEDTATFEVPLGDIDGDGKVEAWRAKVQTKTARVLGVSDVELEAHPLARRVDKAKLEPKPNGNDWPKTTIEHELVEVGP